MTVTAHRARNHANMYGFARHARAYDVVSGVLARPLYRRVVADVTDVGFRPGRWFWTSEPGRAECPGSSPWPIPRLRSKALTYPRR